ncbi:MAG: CoB--CoM heterodisulfide reductase iron-sulfur subunit A family protein [Pseudomonadota bacterium]
MEDVRIGVFVCDCGSNIAGFVDVPEVVEYAKTLPNVVFAKENLYSCSETGIKEIKDSIKEHSLSRVVVASCTPRTHEPTFRLACEESGLNQFHFEMVNIREQCSWVHMRSREDATDKAKDLVRIGVAKAALLDAQEFIIADVNKRALVIGGGIAGLTAAVAFSRRGFEVVLVEKEKELGGRLKDLNKLYPYGVDPSELIGKKIEEATSSPLIEIYTSSVIKSVRGYVGNYEVDVETGGQEIHISCGVIIVATGASVLEPNGLYNYNGENIITQLELEKRLAKGNIEAKNIVMIQCAGARNKERNYCSRTCCMTAIKNATLLKEKIPGAKVYVLYQDMQCYGLEGEALFRKAKEMGVIFINYDPENLPVVGKKSVKVYHRLMGRDMEIGYDLVVLSTPMIPGEDTDTFSKLLRVPRDENGFFLEAHVKLRPLDFATDGIYMCGSAHWPADTRESITQALGAVSRASIHLARGSVKVDPIVSALSDEDLCKGCGLCASLCPYGAIEIIDTPKGKKANMISVACKGCGVCGSTCYHRAIKMNHFTDEQVSAQIAAVMGK